MKTYVINLDRSKDRLKAFRTLANLISLDFERSPATDAQDLSDYLVSEYQAIMPKRFRMSRGEIACLISHQTVWQKIIDSGDPWAFVCEDDVYFDKNIRPLLESDNWLPVPAEIVNAYTCGKRTFYSTKNAFSCRGYHMFELKGWHPGAVAYFISAAACQKLLRFRGVYSAPADNYIFDPTLPAAKALTIYQLYPALCLVNRSLDSLLDPSRAKNKAAHPFSLVYKWRRKALRPFRKIASRVSGFAHGYEYGKIPFDHPP